jgi:hypothetical protein
VTLSANLDGLWERRKRLLKEEALRLAMRRRSGGNGLELLRTFAEAEV